MVEKAKQEIWVVEDSEDQQNLIGTALIKAGYINLKIIPTANKALDLLETSKPALIITDNDTGEGSKGDAVVKAGSKQNTPVIMMSGTEGLRQYALDAGAQAFFVKGKPMIGQPHFTVGLVNKVDELLGYEKEQQASLGR